ncbi:gliding motility-associated C-terminal domain-containing protein [Bacteroidales bacterium OttesenSCG-928-B11]|nr:gliding motility-associated C-terminal domain-containing protein [Bacteroidales bacterium OttesenSCG-928-E04]MDL2308931.1 gliding motility-associated C-terminal domain-containing protein [Bacteroidales bacterium OttesenSCG-928-C03]MDL2312702.1 gliding motility-associated C-terminal domain-containing protein [Bacteroidales bacterium OttesenSCG-928-B11]MDL2326262.1 gliding motility-associated C-terminal domain-containing protein [Bacteroidales bacterium OttesenSCG-928-A14]
MKSQYLCLNYLFIVVVLISFSTTFAQVTQPVDATNKHAASDQRFSEGDLNTLDTSKGADSFEDFNNMEPKEFSMAKSDEIEYDDSATLREFFVIIPNAISASKPDGVNDIFYIPWKVNPDFVSFEIAIYNRSGTLAFYSKDPHFRWDGSFNGKITHNMVFSYVVRLRVNDGEVETIKGTVTVL